ncbi:helix-turn-helix domain-containing protein [Flavitalea sp.]|nr:helix-turn-helix transcriptional regulator [Flavitalea sp.]
MTQLAKNLKLLRKLTGDSQEGFGEMFSVSKAMIASYEGGKARPSYFFLRFVGDYFYLTPEEIEKKELTPEIVDYRPNGEIKKKKSKVSRTNTGEKDRDDAYFSYRIEYIESLKDNNLNLKAHNIFLEKTITDYISTMIDTQRNLLAQTKTLLQWEAEKASDGNRDKKRQVLQQLNNTVSDLYEEIRMKEVESGIRR